MINKKILRNFAIFASILLLGSLFSALPIQSAQAAIDGHLEIISPNGGETYTEGDVVTIRWDASDNIDKIMLGYSTGPGSLNWIAFDTPNTGSYTWKVDVGNTTKTQFVIDITGYETGKGSLTDKSDGWFTVYQKDEFPPVSEPEPTPAPAPAPIPEPEPIPAPISSPTPASIQEEPMQTVQPVIINQSTNISVNITSITQIVLNQNYYFEGSQTTDLTTISDLTYVENFTLDYQETATIKWTEPIDLSTDEAKNAFANLDEYIRYDFWYIYIEWEFWAIWEVPIEITMHDCGCVSAPKILKDGQPVEAEDIKIESDNFSFTAEEAGEYEIQHQLTVADTEPSVSIPDYKIAGIISDPNAKISVTLNGEKGAEEIAVNKEDGSWEYDVNLSLGNNTIKVEAVSEKGEIEPVEYFVKYEEAGSENSYIAEVIIVMSSLFVFIVLIKGLFFKGKKI